MSRPSQQQLARLRNDANEYRARRQSQREDLEAKRQRALQMVDEIKRIRTANWLSLRACGSLPADPPPCTMHHPSGSCADCQAWQADAHELAQQGAVGADGQLTEVGRLLCEAWKFLRADTTALLVAAEERRIAMLSPEDRARHERVLQMVGGSRDVQIISFLGGFGVFPLAQAGHDSVAGV